MHSLLFGNSSDETEDWELVLQSFGLEVFNLKSFLSFEVVIIGFINNNLESGLSSDTIGEGEWVRVFT